MFERLRRYWRLFGAGLGFFLIGMGGVLVFPLLHFFVWGRRRRMAAARFLIRSSFRFIVFLMDAFGVFHCDVLGRERLERGGLLILANHPSLLDIVLLMAFVRRADCIIKRGLWLNPFTHATVRAAGYIRNDSGSNLIIFPEGTRTTDDGSTALKRGAANVAVRGRCDVTPVLIRCAPRNVGKGRRFLRALSRSIHYTIEVREDIPIRPFLQQAGSEVLAARRLTDRLREYFGEDLKSSHAA